MKKVFRIIFNKYLITAAAFAVWMVFFDQNDWMTQKETRKRLEDTKTHIRYLTAETEQMEKEIVQLKNDPQKLEQYARENYRMKRDGEDLYIIERK